MADPGRWSWRPPAGLVPGAGAPPASLIADSWLVEDGRVRALSRHEARFRASCPLPPAEVDGFLAAVRAGLPVSGRWFPRVEAHPGTPSGLVLWLRPAPPPRAVTVLWVPDEPDARTCPVRKGPDLPYLAALRARATETGADDAVLLTAGGLLLETAHSALLWWRGDVLFRPDPALARLPSVTCAVLTELAHARGVRVEHERATLEDLDSAEVWTANSLHGISPVTGWTGARAGKTRAPRAARLASWRSALEAVARPVSLRDNPSASRRPR